MGNKILVDVDDLVKVVGDAIRTRFAQVAAGRANAAPDPAAEREAVKSLFLIYHSVTGRFTWANEMQRGDLEIDLQLLVRKRGYAPVESAMREWADAVAAGDEKGHLWGFLKKQEAQAQSAEGDNLRELAAEAAAANGQTVEEVLREWGVS